MFQNMSISHPSSPGRFLTLRPVRGSSILFLLTVSHINVTLIKEMVIQPKKLLIVTQILLVSTLQNEQITIWRICILMLGRKGLSFRGGIILLNSRQSITSLWNSLLQVHWILSYKNVVRALIFLFLASFLIELFIIQIRGLRWY